MVTNTQIRLFLPSVLLLVPFLTTKILVEATESSSNHKTKKNEPKRPTPSDFLVEGLEDIVPSFATFDGTMYAGQLPMDHADNNRIGGGKLQFWLFAPHRPLAPKTLTIWLNGGPGCTVCLHKRPLQMGLENGHTSFVLEEFKQSQVTCSSDA